MNVLSLFKEQSGFIKALKLTTIEVMCAAVRKQREWHDWKKDGGQYVPNPSTWLNGERWSDEGEVVSARTAPKSAYEGLDL